MRTVGIDIGSFSIKVAELESNLKVATVRDFYEIELNHELGQDVRLEKLEALRRIANQYDPANYRVIVGLGSEFSTQRILTFPFLERRKILQSLPFELEDTIPFSQADAIFDFRIIRQRENSSQVLAVAVPKKHIQELLILCEDAGLDPDIISLDGIALGNLFEIPGEDTVVDTTTAELVIHIGYSKTLINVEQGGSLIASRALYFGGKDLAASVSRAYQLPYLEALKSVAEKGFVLTTPEGADENQRAFSQVMSQALAGLVGDLHRTIVDLKSELQLQFTKGFLIGGMSRLLNLGPYLTQELEIPVNVLQHLGRATKVFIPISEQTDKASSVAIGLALEGVRKPKNPAINLRRGDFSKQGHRFQLFWNQYQDLVKVGAVILVAFFIYSPLRSSFVADNVTAVEKALRDQAKNPALNIPPSQLKPELIKKFLKAKRDEFESKKEVVRLNQTSSALDVMRNISSAIPQKAQINLDIRHFDLQGEKLTLEGLVNNKAEFDFLQKSLSQVSMVSQVKAGQPSFIPPPNRFGFRLAMNVVRVPPPEKKTK